MSPQEEFLSMSILELIEKKRDGKELDYQEIKSFVDGVMAKEVDEVQIGAILMAITASGFTAPEAYYYAKALAESGEMLNVSSIAENAVDKHSTGGVTDSCTLVVLPVLASLGLTIAKYSTKNIGASFGTLDRLGVFSGYKPAISMRKFYQIIKSVGISIIGSNEKILPADRILYKYREQSGTVPSIPLIASSIMAKKIAMGTKTVVLDVKCGEGSLLKNVKQAENLAKLMIEIGSLAGIKTSAIISTLDQPLGMTIGPMLEVREAIKLLSGESAYLNSDLYKLCSEMVVHILMETGKAQTRTIAEEMFDEAIKNGSAKEKLRDMIVAHGGNPKKFDNDELLIPGVNSFYIAAEKSGYLFDINLKGLYQAINIIGAGSDGSINRNVGVELMAREGQHVLKGDKLAKVYYALDDPNFASAVMCIRKCFKVEKRRPEKKNVVYKII